MPCNALGSHPTSNWFVGLIEFSSNTLIKPIAHWYTCNIQYYIHLPWWTFKSVLRLLQIYYINSRFAFGTILFLDSDQFIYSYRIDESNSCCICHSTDFNHLFIYFYFYFLFSSTLPMVAHTNMYVLKFRTIFNQIKQKKVGRKYGKIMSRFLDRVGLFCVYASNGPVLMQ